jgi:trehalose 6-phosphate synthase/phosphatase
MAHPQLLTDDYNSLTDSPRPLAPDEQESSHPGMRSSLTKVPVTPGISLGEYAPDEDNRGNSSPSYFQDVQKLREKMPQTPSDADSGARSNKEILRRMSLTKGTSGGKSVAEIDPRAANPSLGLSGGIISATFCIPHSLQYRKGSPWVRLSHVCKSYN